MPPLILHHYPLSTFSEKVRVALSLKGLAWGSVDIVPAPPRPLLIPLTGGYRRVPVLRPLPTLDALSTTLRLRASFEQTLPR